MNLDSKRQMFKRPNSEQIFGAPAQATGGIKGVIAGKWDLTFFAVTFYQMKVLRVL